MINVINHIRIICKLGDLSQTYTRLVELHNLIGNKLEYAFDSKAGFLVSFPEEIGDGGFTIELEAKGEKFKAKTKYGSTIIENVNSIIKELAT